MSSRSRGPWRSAPLLACALSLAAGCGPSTHELELRELTDTVHTLQERLARSDQRAERLSNELIMMANRLDALQASTAVPPRDDPPPLEVVKLAPGGQGGPELGPPAQPAEPEPEEPPVEITITGPGDDPRIEVTPVPEAPQEHAGRDERLFRAALDAYRRGDSAAALDRFGRFVRRHPRHPRAPDALYWMGECHMELHDDEAALAAFRRLVRDHPTSSKAPDAHLKSGIALEKLGRGAEARRAFEAVIARYPNTALADLARSRLSSRSAP